MVGGTAYSGPVDYTSQGRSIPPLPSQFRRDLRVVERIAGTVLVPMCGTSSAPFAVSPEPDTASARLRPIGVRAEVERPAERSPVRLTSKSARVNDLDATSLTGSRSEDGLHGASVLGC